MLADLLLRSRDLVTFYTDAGVLPRSVLWATFPTLSTFSIHTVSGAAWVQGLLFVLAGVCAASLALGYRTRTAALLSWLLLVSLHARNPEVLNGGDSVLRRILFWGVFLPLGSRWSLDARREVGDGWLRSALRPRFGPEGRVVGVAAAGLLVQVVLVYTTNAAFKLDRGAWLGGDAMRHVFELGTFTTPLGAALSTQGALLGAVEAVWLAMVVCSALLVVLRGWPRTLFASLFIGGHLFMFLTMRLGVFPVVSMVSLLPFLPPKVWDAVERAAPSPGALPGAIRPGLGENSRPAGSAPTADAADHGDVTGRLAAVGHGLRTVGAVGGFANMFQLWSVGSTRSTGAPSSGRPRRTVPPGTPTPAGGSTPTQSGTPRTRRCWGASRRGSAIAGTAPTKSTPSASNSTSSSRRRTSVEATRSDDHSSRAANVRPAAEMICGRDDESETGNSRKERKQIP